MNEASAELLQAVVATYTALAADVPFAVAVVRTTLQFARGMLEHIKEITAPQA